MNKANETMLPIYNAHTIRQWDNYTLENESISATDLMERAAMRCVQWITENIPAHNNIAIICGNGNNGGDGIAIARLLMHSTYVVKVYIHPNDHKSSENKFQLKQLKAYGFDDTVPLNENDKNPFENTDAIVDCIFGTGLNKAIHGFWENVIECINQSGCKIISIDIPSGLSADPSSDNHPQLQSPIVKANYTLTFQTPKLGMLLAAWGNYCGSINILDIHLSSDFISSHPSDTFFITIDDIKARFKKREKFSHKGIHGHALIVAGNKGQCGASILCSKACMKCGVGLVTLRTFSCCFAPIHSAIPEVMIEDIEDELLKLNRFSAIGIGPATGKAPSQVSLLKTLLTNSQCPMVLDADALTLIAQNPELFIIPRNTIITPHPKEFDRLAGISANAFERLEKARLYSEQKNCVVVLKGAYTAICQPDGKLYFNSTGNPGMATAGSGDVLTGILTALLAQGYTANDAAIVGVYVHGLAGDLAAQQNSQTGLIASDIVDHLSSVFLKLET